MSTRFLTIFRSAGIRRALGGLLLGALMGGCSGAAATAGPASPGQVTRRDIQIRHQECPVEGAGAEKINIGGDPSPDIVIVRSGGREVCRSVDLNFDGTVDSWVYLSPQGTESRRENDYDRDGRIDEIAVLAGGVLAEKHRATTLAGRLDTWHFYQGGKLSRTERDSDGDALVDQWWEYPSPERTDCPLIHSDVDGDGRPDPGATVNVCGEASGYVPPERAAAASGASPGFESSAAGGLPTEVEEKPASGTTTEGAK